MSNKFLECTFQLLYLPVDKKEKIIHGAMKLLIENGMQATPMSAIAKEAGTGMGTIYNYFATKEELVNSIFIFIKQDQIKNIMIPLTDKDIKKQFNHYYRGIIQYLINHPSYFHYLDQFHSSPVLSIAVRDQGLKIITPIVDLIMEGQKQGLIKSIGIRELLEFLDGGLMGFVRWLLVDKKSLSTLLLDNQVLIAWDAIKQ